MEPLIVCPSCHRHVKCSQAACPFCKSSIPAGVALAGAAALAIVLAACGEAVALYGAPPPDGGYGGSVVDVDAGTDAGGSGGMGGAPIGAYGPPPHPDP